MSGAVVVTGATGFLARHLLPLLGADVVACVRDRRTWDAEPWTGALAARVVESPLAEAERRLADLGSARAVLHLAALVEHSRAHADAVYAANVDGTLAAVRLAARLGACLVFASTSGTVGCFRDASGRADETAPFCEEVIRSWPYYHSKLVAERRARALAEELGVELTVVRLPILLGPGDHRGRSTGHVRRFVEGRLPFLVAGGIQVVDVRDVAPALAALVARGSRRPVYHLAGFAGSSADFFDACGALVGRAAPRRLPYAVAWGLAAASARVARLTGGRSRLPDPVVVEMARCHWHVTSRWADELGFVARPLEQTLADTVAWHRGAAPR